AVAAELRELAPTARIVLVPDAGQEAAAAEIAREVRAAVAEMPAGSPKNFDANDFAAQAGLDALAQLLAKPVEPARRFRVMTGADVAALPPVQWLVQGVLPTEGLACVFGAPGSGKSFIVLDLLAAVAAGRPWFGLRTVVAPTTLLSLEGAGGIAQRVQAFRSRHGEVPPNLRFVAQAFELLGDDDVDELAAAVRAAGGAGGVIVLDTLSAAAPGQEENSGADMGLLVQAAKRLQGLLGGLVLLVHHSGKVASKGLRGHSSLLAALDAAIEVLRDGSARRWRVAKSKDDRDGDEHPFRLDVVELGIDQHGEAITSCVIAPEEHAGDAVRRVRLDALGEAFRGAGDFGQAGAPAGRPCVRVEAAVEHCRGRLTCPPDRQAERARSAITGLVSRGVLVLRDGWLYLP
ncbi:MAG: AAA family ATPase, partial [Burkholderiales bacterium]|nr:AAA family ATPase [Burkholderiales bacterium]